MHLITNSITAPLTTQNTTRVCFGISDASGGHAKDITASIHSNTTAPALKLHISAITGWDPLDFYISGWTPTPVNTRTTDTTIRIHTRGDGGMQNPQADNEEDEDAQSCDLAQIPTIEIA